MATERSKLRLSDLSFGPALMIPGMADAYRAGYCLMVVGLLATFTA